MTQLVTINPNRQVGSQDLPDGTAAILGLLGRNTLWLWLDRGLLQVGTLVAGLLLVRYLGPANFGIYSIALSVGTVIGIGMDLGFTRYAARAVAASPQEGSAILASGLFVSAVMLVGEVIGLLGMAAWRKWYIACLCAGLVLGNLQRIATLSAAFLTAELRSRAILLGSFIARLGTIAVIGLVIWQRLSVTAVLLGVSVISTLVVSIRLWQLRPYLTSSESKAWSQLNRVVTQAWPFFSYSLTQIGYEQLSVVGLSLVASREEVGWFSSALVIANVFPQWTFASADALLPLMTRLFESRRVPEMLQLGQRIVEFLLIISVPVAVALSVFAPESCRLLGPRFASSALVLRLLSIRLLLSVLIGAVGEGFLIATDRVKERRNAAAAALAILAVLTLLLGHIWGAAGAAVALIAASTVRLLQYIHICSRINLSLRWRGGLWTTALGGLAMAITCLHMPKAMSWWIRPAPAVFVYFAVLAMVGRNRLADAWRTLGECVTGT
jgi:PST family polysaccharide transporter